MQLTRNDLTLSNAPRAKFMLSVRFERRKERVDKAVAAAV